MAQQDYNKLFKAWQPEQSTLSPTYNINQQSKLLLQAYQNQLSTVKTEQDQRKKASTGTRILETIVDVPLSLIEGFSKGVEGLVDAGIGVIGGIGGLFGADDFQQQMADKIAYDWTGQNISRAFEGITDDSYIDNTIFDKAITSVGQMLPSIGLSMIAPGLGTAGFMASAGGSGMEEALNYGADYKKSFLYGLASGVTEGLIETVSGGIGGIGSGFVDGLFGKLTKNTAVKIGISMLGEGAEEVASELVRPKLERIYKNKEDIDPITFQTVTESFIVGALASGILQGASVKLSSYANKKQANQINTEIREITTLEEQLVQNDKMTPEIAENLKEQKTEKLAQIEQIIASNTNTQTTQENAENGLKEAETSEIAIQEQTQQEIKPTNENKTQAFIENDKGEYEIKDYVIEEDLSSDLKLVRDSEGKYNILYKDGVLLQKKSNTKKYMQELFETLQNISEGDLSRVFMPIYNKAIQEGRINRFNELINKNVDNSKVSVYNDVSKGVKKDDISRVQSSIREGINKNDGQSTKSTTENGTIQRGNSRKIQNQSEIRSKGNSTSSIYEYAIKQANSQEFYDSLKQAKNNMEYSPFVDLHEVSDYQQNKNFLNEAKDAGFSITKDGNIISVFKSDNSKTKKVLDTFIPMAIENGGNHLDCFNFGETGLVYLYEEYGFQPIAKLKFDRNYAPDGWDYNKWGEPDIVFMVHNGDDANTVKQKIGTYPHADLSKIDYVDSYDKGLEEYKKYIKTVDTQTQEETVVKGVDDNTLSEQQIEQLEKIVNGGGENNTPPPTDNTPKPNPLSHPAENVDTLNKVAISSDIPKAKKSWWQELVRKFVNSMVAIENFLKGKVSNPEAVVHSAKLGSAIAGDWFNNGVGRVTTDTDGKPILQRKSKSFIKLFDFLRGKDKAYEREYYDYLLHRHNTNRMDIEFTVELNSEQRSTLDQALANNEISQELYNALTNTEQPIKCSEVRNLVLEHQGLMSENTLNTVLELMGDQKPVFSKEVTFEDSERKVAEYERLHPEFKQHAQDLYDYNNALLERQVEEGIISQETKDKFNQMYPNYVPTHRQQYQQTRGGMSKGTVQSGIKGAKGSDLVIAPIDQQIFYQTQLVARSIAVNPFLKTLGDNADGKDVKVVDKTDKLDDISKIEPKKNRYTYFETVTNEDGTTKIVRTTIEVNDEIAQGINSLTPISMDADVSSFLQKVRVMNSLFKKVTTAFNPFFSFWRNPIRDIQNALTFTKFSIKDYSRNLAKAFKIIFFDKANIEYQIFIASGGASTSIYDYEATTRGINPKTKGGKLISKLESASQMIEQLPRFAEYLASREKGLSVQESILNSAEVTVNFQRSGTVMRLMNSTFMPFANPKLQGSLKFFRAFTSASSRRAIMLFAVRCAVLGIVPSVINNALYDDEEEYKDIRQEDKNLNYLFKVGDTWIKIPKGQLIGAISATYNRTTNAVKGEDFAFDGYLDELNQSISPIENFRTIFSPFTDAATNTTWYGGQIEGMKFDRVRPRDRYDESTSWIAKGIGQVINYSPKKINYLIDQYTGVIGDILLPMTTPKYRAGALEKTFIYNPTTSSKYYDQFYKLLEQENYKKTDGDMIAKAKVKFLNKVSSSIGDLYKEQQRINNDSSLSREEKRKQNEVIQILINNTQKNALENVKSLGKLLENYTLTEETFDEDYRNATRLVFGSEFALQDYDSRVYEKASALNKAKIDFDLFYDVYFDTRELEGDFDNEGKTISGSKKTQIEKYIDRLPIPKTQKYMLFGALGYKSTKGEEIVKKYVNSLPISLDEKIAVLKACNYD